MNKLMTAVRAATRRASTATYGTATVRVGPVTLLIEWRGYMKPPTATLAAEHRCRIQSDLIIESDARDAACVEWSTLREKRRRAETKRREAVH